jgi:hypothetical protein
VQTLHRVQALLGSGCLSEKSLRVIRSIWLFIVLSGAAIGASAEEHWHNATGASLAALFSDKEFADGAHFAYRLQRDGTFTGTELGKKVSGTWRVVGDQLCWSWERPPGPRECYDVQQDGASIRLLINQSEAWYGTLQPLR